MLKQIQEGPESRIKILYHHLVANVRIAFWDLWDYIQSRDVKDVRYALKIDQTAVKFENHKY